MLYKPKENHPKSQKYDFRPRYPATLHCKARHQEMRQVHQLLVEHVLVSAVVPWESLGVWYKFTVFKSGVLRLTDNNLATFTYFAWQKLLVEAAQGAAYLPREGAQGARTNSRAVGPRSTWTACLRCHGAQRATHLRGSGTMSPATRCPGMPNPRHGLPAPRPVGPCHNQTTV